MTVPTKEEQKQSGWTRSFDAASQRYYYYRHDGRGPPTWDNSLALEKNEPVGFAQSVGPSGSQGQRTITSASSDSTTLMAADECEPEAKESVAFLLQKQVWPPLRVEEDLNGYERKYAHGLYAVLFLAFLALSVYTLFTSYGEDNLIWSSEFKRKGFNFPVVTICGDGYNGRMHEILGHKCEFTMSSNLHEDDDSLNEDRLTKCESKVVGQLRDQFDVTYDDDTKTDTPSLAFKGDCVVFNGPAKQFSDENGDIGMDIYFNAILSNSDEQYCDWCSQGQAPKNYIVLISENDPSDHEEKWGWNSFSIPESGLTEFTLDLTKQSYQDGAEWEVYGVSGLASFPWDVSVTGENATTLSMISISTSETGVLYMTSQQPKIQVILGSIWGFFCLITTVFYIFFVPHPNRPNALVRVKDFATLKMAAEAQKDSVMELGK